jgi:DNA-binding NtrC family response regulator
VSIGKSNILIVDDNEDHQVLMEEALRQFIEEVNVVFAGTGEECLLELSKENYDAVIIDFNLSDMDGLEVLRSMNYKEYKTPSVMVTAFGDENVAVEAMKLGAFDYIVKSDNYLKKLASIILKVMHGPKLKKEKETAEDDLRASELKYKTLIDNMIDVVFTADKELTIISVNLAGQRVFESSCEDIKGLNFYDLIFDADR